MQETIIIILFLGALGYLGNMLYKQTKSDSGCSKNCGCDSPVSHLKKAKEH
ncbi:FeoB-associated Cys-rich membrane protein [Fulvivirga sp. 29W222]|uniref:FeoB-associated Cys-rich membrane protein n=1 Tax=Fulvivirga marina TaxID=2494733 RepID=A0A937FUZ3_9BACT|nr:FeoB-associated Cys-rich membrane protein [Fulvivirga marina]MBL6445002.1 FeoB-associated Cys-rich membrane protein [Fulvivirga marina]